MQVIIIQNEPITFVIEGKDSIMSLFSTLGHLYKEESRQKVKLGLEIILILILIISHKHNKFIEP